MSAAGGKLRVGQGPLPEATPADDLHAAYRRHLNFDVVVDADRADDRQRFEALALAIRDRLAGKWLSTDRAYAEADPKRIYYLSLEYLPGRVLASHIASLGLGPEVARLVALEGLDLDALEATEPDPALGNGGLGRLAACYLDSLATLAIPAMGYGLRYQYGIFRQEIIDGRQVERPDNWLLRSDPWEVARYPQAVETRIHCAYDFELGLTSPPVHGAVTLRGIPYDRPVVGYGARNVNTLRLWSAHTPDYFDLDEFNHGDFFGAVHDKLLAENITRVLYPSDSTSAGHHLRFLQEYFLVACSLADIVRRFRAGKQAWGALPDKVAIQLNDTHPALAVAELMRILLDEALLGWDESWDITTRTLAYTNHTLLPEAFERWPVSLFEMALPRHLEIIYEINRRFLDQVRSLWPGDEGRVQRASLIEEGAAKQVRMAHFAVVGSHSTNGVSEIHTALLRERTMKDLAEVFPRRFNNKTNGVTPRRWLVDANPSLSALITEAIGEGWITDAGELRRLAPLAGDAAFRERFLAARRAAKERLAAWVSRSLGATLDPASIFDSQIKRIHEYKRQLLNMLRIIILYERLRQSPNMAFTPRTFLFAGKAAPDYRIAKLIILLINRVAETIARDVGVRGRINVLFLPDYGVTLAERLIPATDVSEQISTAGFEASGTGNMKLMMNGALTVGTRDGATLEMARRAGEDNIFLFGLTADEVQGSRGWYDPRWHYAHEPQTRAALDLIASDHFSAHEPGLFAPIVDGLLRDDYYMHLADLRSYLETQARVGALYEDRNAWAQRAILNVASSGWFSSDRAIAQYASEIWKVGASPVGA